MAKISYSKLLDPLSDIITLMESTMTGAFGTTTGDQRECFKRIHAYCWGLHTLVMDVITALGIDNVATRPAVLERFKSLQHPAISTLENLLAGFDGPLNEEQQTAMDFAHESLLSLERMMSNIWQFSSLARNRIEYADDEFSGELLIQKLRAELQGIRLPALDANFTVLGDEAYLSIALGEIAHNIRQHAGVERASIAIQDFGYRADITIYDKGHGFHSRQGLAFEPFWQADAASPGLGLGLYLARKHIEGCGGKIALSSQLGRGTLVKLSLPTLP